jgi:hypothetical protein
MSSHRDFVVQKSALPAKRPDRQPLVLDDEDDDNDRRSDSHETPKKKRKRASAKEKKPKEPRRTVVQRTMAEMRASFAVSGTTSTATTKHPVEQKRDKDDAGESDSTIDLTKDSTSKPVAQSSSSTATTASTSKPDGSRPAINEWPGVVLMARNTSIHSVTCVDPGTRNFALCRVEFCPKIRITHIRVLDLHELARDYERDHPSTKIIDIGSPPTIDAQLFALQAYINAEISLPNGCFNSSMVIVEEQSFDRTMARVEASILAVVNTKMTPIRLNESNTIPRGQVISSRSVKTCYRPLFPDLPPEALAAASEKSIAGRRPFGMGDVHGNRGAERQRQENKRNAIKYGRLMLPQSQIEAVVPAANLTDTDAIRLLRAKSDDLYDTLFMATYFASSYLFFYNKVNQGFTAQETFNSIEAPPQRPHNCWQELFEFCSAIGTPLANMQKLMDVLFASKAKITVTK